MKSIKKIISAFALTTCAFACAWTVNAAAETVDLAYIGTGSSANSAIVSFGATGFSDIASYEVYMKADTNKIVDYNVRVALDGMEHSYVAYKSTSISDEGILSLNGSQAVPGTNAAITSPGTILELEIFFENDITEDFQLKLLDAGTGATYIEGTSGVNDWADISENDVVITIPAAGGGGTKVDFPGSEALNKTRYDEDTSTVPVDSWSTTINWANYKPAKLFWSISNNAGETGKVEAKMATVTGELATQVTYGLAIAGQAAELDTITEVKLVVE